MGPHLLTEAQARAAFPADAVVVRPQVSGVGYVVGLVLQAGALALLVLPWERAWVPPAWALADLPTPLALLFGFFLLLLGRGIFRSTRRRRHPGAWRLALSRDKVWLNMRSVHHVDWSATDKTILQLDRHDVDRVTPRRGKVPTGFTQKNGQPITKDASQIWFVLRDPVTESLMDAVLLENTKIVGGRIIRSRTHDEPLQLGKKAHDLCLTLPQTRPDFYGVLDLLRARGLLVEAEAPLDMALLRPNRRRMTPAMEAEIKNLAQTGRKIEAIRLLRDCTGLGLKEAKQAIETQNWQGDGT